MSLPSVITDWSNVALNWGIVWPIAQGMIVFFIVLSAKSWVEKLFNWFRFKSQLRMSLGTGVRFGTATGTIDGKIVEANMNYIVVKHEDGVHRIIPTKKARDMEWVLLDYKVK